MQPPTTTHLPQQPPARFQPAPERKIYLVPVSPLSCSGTPSRGHHSLPIGSPSFQSVIDNRVSIWLMRTMFSEPRAGCERCRSMAFYRVRGLGE